MYSKENLVSYLILKIKRGISYCLIVALLSIYKLILSVHYRMISGFPVATSMSPEKYFDVCVQFFGKSEFG